MSVVQRPDVDLVRIAVSIIIHAINSEAASICHYQISQRRCAPTCKQMFDHFIRLYELSGMRQGISNFAAL